MPFPRVAVGALVSLVGLSPGTLAELRFNGFASIKAATTLSSPADLNNDGKITGAEGVYFGNIDEDLDFKHFSVFGLQASADLSEGLSATIQLYADGAENFDVEARWAYLSYAISDNTTINAGRLVLPIFYKSEYEKVGYAYNPATLPLSVYSPLEFSVVEGLRLNNVSNWGMWTISSALLYGNWDGDIFVSSNNAFVGGNAVKDILSLSIEANYDWLTLFAGGIISDTEFTGLDQNVINASIDAAITLNPQIVAALEAGLVSLDDFEQLKQRVSLSDKRGKYYYFGLDLDYQDWLFTAEYAHYGIEDSSDTFNDAWYATFGRRMEDWTLLYTHQDYDQPQQDTYIEVLDLNPIAQGVGVGIIDTFGVQDFKLDVISVRYDFHPSAAFKLDLFNYDAAKQGDKTAGIVFGVYLVF